MTLRCMLGASLLPQHPIELPLVNGKSSRCSDPSAEGRSSLERVFSLRAVTFLAQRRVCSISVAGVLLVVCWNMAEKIEFVRLLKTWRPAAVALVTFGLTLARDLTAGIVAGCVVAALFALLRRPLPEEGE